MIFTNIQINIDPLIFVELSGKAALRIGSKFLFLKVGKFDCFCENEKIVFEPRILFLVRIIRFIEYILTSGIRFRRAGRFL